LGTEEEFADLLTAEINRDDAVALHDVHDRAGPLATIT
jgi:hypothetical protein